VKADAVLHDVMRGRHIPPTETYYRPDSRHSTLSHPTLLLALLRYSSVQQRIRRCAVS
jgi:hypothetical protein